MQLFLLMTATVLGMLLLLLITPDLEDSILQAMRRYHYRNKQYVTLKFDLYYISQCLVQLVMERGETVQTNTLIGFAIKIFYIHLNRILETS